MIMHGNAPDVNTVYRKLVARRWIHEWRDFHSGVVGAISNRCKPPRYVTRLGHQQRIQNLKIRHTIKHDA